MEITSELLLDLKGGRGVSSLRVRSVLGFCAGVFIATVVAVFSVNATDELASWWTLAMVFNLISLIFVALAWQGIGYLFPKAMLRNGWLACCVQFLFIWMASLLMVVFAALLMGLSLLGAVLTFVPFVSAVAFFWSVGHNAGLKTCVCGAFVLLVIFARLLMLPSAVAASVYPFAGSQDDDIRVMSWNLGGGAPFFAGSDEANVDKIIEIVRRNAVHVLCMQEVPSGEFLNRLTMGLEGEWKGGRSPGGPKSTAILSRIGGEVNAPLATMDYGGPTVLRITSHKGELQFVNCHGSPGRKSGQRRVMVEWILHELRDLKKKTVICGDFNIDTSRRWTFMDPLLSDSLSFDTATWRALGLMGDDPGFDAGATSPMGRRSSWMVVDRKMPITGYQILKNEQKGGMGHFPVLLRVGLGRAGRITVAD